MQFNARPLLVSAAALGIVAGVAPARAADPNWVELFRSQAIKCLHGTVNPDKAVIEVIKGPQTVGEVTTVRLKTYYDGLVRRNVMETDLMVRQSGSIRQLKISPLSDTGTSLTKCELEKTWRDF